MQGSSDAGEMSSIPLVSSTQPAGLHQQFPYFGKLPNASFTQLILGLSISPCSRLHCIYYAPNASPELAEKHINSAQKLHRTIRSLQTRQTFGEKAHNWRERGQGGRALQPLKCFCHSAHACGPILKPCSQVQFVYFAH